MSSPVIIVGVGALGSHVALLGRNWAGGLRIVDFDKVESKNVMSQFHTSMGKGRNKAEALKQAMQGMFGIRVDAVPHKLTRDNAQALLGSAALVLDCTDNADARRVIQGFVRQAKIPCLHGALSADGSFGRVIWDAHFREDEEGAPGQATCEDGENLPFHALVGAQMAIVAQRFLRTGAQQSFQITPAGAMRIA